MWFENIKHWLLKYPIFYDNLKFLGVIILAYVVYWITRKIIFKGIESLISKTKTEVDDLIFNDRLLRRIAFIAPLFVIHEFTYLIPGIQVLLNRFIESLIVLVVLLIIGGIVSIFNDIYEKSGKHNERPIKGYLQVVKIIIFVLGGILIVGIITGQRPWTLLTGIGALTAIIILIFRDTILSFVASIQISSYDLLKKGDWIEMPKYGADGDVIDISLNVIKVQNWDKTITVIPTYKLIDESFKNWRGMQLTGGRRIKRAVYIDLSSVKFCDENMLNKFENYRLISSYIKSKREEIKKYNSEKGYNDEELINGRRLTNLGTFRIYLKEYLKQREDINTDLTFLIRHLEPGPTGLPIEIYVFANTIEWSPYEDIQADVFDHIFAIVPQFELRIFQNPTGSDFKNIIAGT